MRKRIMVVFLAGMLCLQGLCLANASMDTKAVPDTEAETAAPAAKGDAAAAKSDTKEDAGDDHSILKGAQRFRYLLQEGGYIYYLDKESARWVSCPHSSEQMLEVWVKLVDTSEGGTASSGNGYSYSSHYYLEHYYIRPDKEQIQFLSELEVTGRPSNAIAERPYNESNWEKLVPGSIEDEIYRAVVKNVKDIPKKNDAGEKSSVRDAIEEYLRISL